MKHSKYYYDYTRNIDEHKEIKEAEKVIQKLIDLADNPIPNYYIGNTYGYEARKVVEDWNLSYNIGTAVTYLLRAGKKKENGMDDKAKHIEDIKKAINHLNFELDKLNNKEK